MTPDPLRSWHDRIFFLLLGLRDIDLKGSGVRLDYSRRSLVELEREVLERFAGPKDLRRPGPGKFVDGLTAYIGETLMRAAGGKWVWGQTRSALGGAYGPVASADPVLALDPVAPVELLVDVVTARSGDRLTGTYDRWARAVESHRGSDRLWQPQKQRTMADDSPEDTEALRSWLEVQETGFPGWVADFGAGGVWDFGPASLPALEEVLRRSVDGPAELSEPGHRRLRDGAAWYLGETFRRRLGGRWIKLKYPADDWNFPTMRGLGPRQTHRLTPVLALESALENPGRLSERFAAVSET